MLEVVAKDIKAINKDKLKNKKMFCIISVIKVFTPAYYILPVFFYLSDLKLSINKEFIYLK